MAQIDEEFRDKGILRGRTLRFRASDALALIHRCRDRGVRVLGIDGFVITENVTQPLMEHSIDLSDSESLQNPINCWDRAEEFLKAKIKTDLYFEIVMEEHK